MKKITISRCGARLKGNRDGKKVVLSGAECKSCNDSKSVRRYRTTKNIFENSNKEVKSDE